MTVRFGYAIFTVATLSFLGVGLQPPSPDWGLSVSEEYTNMISGRLVVRRSSRRWPSRAPSSRSTSSPTRSSRSSTNDDRDGRRRHRRAQPTARADAALQVEDLSLAYLVRGIPRPVLRGVSFEVRPGESYGLVGESGCGKSTTAYAAVRYLPRNARITGGRILVAGDDVT